MDIANKTFNDGLKWKQEGGVPLEVFVSDSIWLGGLHESRSHLAFVAIGPEEWDGEEELSFFKTQAEVDAFIEKLQAAANAAFGADSVDL